MPTVVLNTTETTFVSSALPENNFSSYPSLFTGTDLTYETCISFLKFNLASIPIETVDSAYLQLSVIVKTVDATSPIIINRVSSELDTGTVTYHTKPAYTATASTANVTGENLYGCLQFDITQLVNQWLSGTYNNYGLALSNPDGVSSVQFATNNIVYEPYFPKLILNYSSSPVETRAYAYIYNTGKNMLESEGTIPFSSNGIVNGITHNAGTGPVIITTPGTYAVWFSVSSLLSNQFALYQNNVPVPGSVYGTGAPYGAGNTGMVIVNAAAGDSLTVESHTSTPGTEPVNEAREYQTNINSSILVMKIGPVSQPDQALADVNPANTADEMKKAVTAASTGLKLDGFHAVTAGQQEQVLTQLITQRPPQGYFSVSDLQAGLDAAIEYSVDYMHIYVASKALNGTGSIRHPFGTLEQAVAAVSEGGTIHVSGIFDIKDNIAISKPGITLAGDRNPQLIARSAAAAVSLSAGNVVLDGLTFICDSNYGTSIIEISSNNTSIINCNIFGPGKPEPQAAYQDGITVAENVSEFNIENNNINSLRKGIRILGSSSGTVQFNIISNTITGIEIGGGKANLTGNAWGSLPNTADMEFLQGTARSAPYDNIYRITALNNNAKIINLE